MTADEIREAFLRFFEGKGHLRLPSSSLIPAGDPTLLLTTAGMVQIKPYFTGEMTPPSRRLTSCQKCFRTTDIDSVGDSTHLTFFEMLGNFSVGDYFKPEAIQWAWEFVTGPLGLAQERLWVTVYRNDDEAHDHWVGTGVPTERIRRFGEKDNFWGPAGDEGPCGPCSEIHYDFGAERGCRRPECGPNCENIAADTGRKCDRFVELWNLVFTQYYQDANGSRTPLPAPNIDTGMGLERAAAIVQGKRTVYETDLFQPIVQRVAELCGKQYGQAPETDYAMRVVAEHARSAAFLIADDVVPGRYGRDYVLRRLLRRAVYFGMRKLRIEPPFLTRVVEAIIQQFGLVYPELATKVNFILHMVTEEEARFAPKVRNGEVLLRTLIPFRMETLLVKSGTEWRQRGLDAAVNEIKRLGELYSRRVDSPEVVRTITSSFVQELENAWHTGQGVNVLTISGQEVFVLWATYGFPPELTREIARERGLDIDWGAFQEEMHKHAETSRGTEEKFGGDFDAIRVYQDLGVGATRFLGYETLGASSVVVGLLSEGQPVNRAAKGKKVEVVLRETPFYAEMGGQVGDEGEIAGPSGTLHVDDTQSPITGLTVHRCTVLSGTIALGDAVEARVDVQRRQDIARNHTATHMLHAALRRVLGTHVRQHGSLVAPDRLRFDFTHVSPLSHEELREVQRLTNEKIRENMPVESHETTYRQAVADGALAFFGDRYGDQVRVVKVADDPSTGPEPALSSPKGQSAPFSVEVCGGTHVRRTGDIGLCHIVSESSIGSGLRRIEAVTGRGAEALLAQHSASLEEAAHRLQVTPDQLVPRVDSLLTELEQSRKRAEALERELLKRQVEELPQREIAGTRVVSGILSVSAAELLREAGDWLRNDIKSGVIVMGAVLDGRPSMVVMATRDVVARGFHAGNVVRDAARAMGGGGGGRPEMGQAGGREPGKLRDALQAAEDEIRRWGEKP